MEKIIWRFVHIAMFMLSLEEVVVYIKQFNFLTYRKQYNTVQVQFVDIIHLINVRPPSAAKNIIGGRFLVFL